MTTIAAQLLADLPRADVLQVLTVFADEVVRLIRTIETQAVAGNRAGVKRAAHSLAGAAGTVGAAELEAAARAAMRDSADADLTTIVSAIRVSSDVALEAARQAAAEIAPAA